MIAIVLILIGILLAAAGVYYLIKEKQDHESRMIYIVTLLAGLLIAAAGLVVFFMAG